MGQYHLITNVTKREFIEIPHIGLKQKEIVWNNGGAVLIPLLSISNCRGGGDLGEPEDIFDHAIPAENQTATLGRWAGDIVLLVGDYTEPDDISGLPDGRFTAADIYHLCAGNPTQDEIDSMNAHRVEWAERQGQPTPPPFEKADFYTDITPHVMGLLDQLGVYDTKNAA